MKNKLPRKLKKKLHGTRSMKRIIDKNNMLIYKKYLISMSNMIPKDMISEAFCENYRGLSNYILTPTATPILIKK